MFIDEVMLPYLRLEQCIGDRSRKTTLVDYAQTSLMLLTIDP